MEPTGLCCVVGELLPGVASDPDSDFGSPRGRLRHGQSDVLGFHDLNA